jgi:hypothetical protein
MGVACPAHFMILDLSTLIIFGTNDEAPHYAILSSFPIMLKS